MAFNCTDVSSPAQSKCGAGGYCFSCSYIGYCVGDYLSPHNVFMTIEPKKVNLPAKWMKAHRVQGYNKQLAARLLSVNTS